MFDGNQKLFAIRRLSPSIITLLALICGMSAIRFAMLGRFDAAVIALVLAALLDVLDGRVAILFKATSKFGAELDSLADLISFGVAPAFILYIWTLSSGGSFGWIATVLFVLCAALRLARYNTLDSEETETAPRTKKIFTGVPTPSGAGMALLPLIFSINWETDGLRNEPRIVALWLIIVGLMMVSRLPTPALKGWRIPAALVLPLMIVVVLIAANLVTDPFMTLSLLGIVNLAALPAFYLLRLKQKI